MSRKKLFIISVIVGGAMNFIGGLLPPSPPKCPGCAVLIQPTAQCNSPVQGGYTC